MKIVKKIWPEYYDLIVSGKKKFELRAADFEANEGDILEDKGLQVIQLKE